ncbi:pentatricopeptide repeat-containing protein 2, mitochondrial isoform X1 [Etheostoma cragini]|uniref:pentatricopeptide repeat-containing protein 2, mitochondrial isoform X1 n=1 Tax=Etheostoma cragini TaxID=417921 RepID=UPI00155EB373|nr:pentatricopeptide repeat-containing protein 2, mitochondrial isoform X1 [Etheostoma cragini]
MVQSVGTMALARIGKCCRSLVHDPSKGLFCGVLQPGWIDGCVGAKRHLLSEDVIKLQDFQQRKLAVAHLVTGTKGNYIELFSHKLQRNELILRDELKLLLHLCQSADDMMIARDAIYRYHAENRNLVYGEFKFGPLFMRLCYEQGLEDLAAATITDKSMREFFNDATSFNIALDMLFTKGSHENALEVLRTMRNQGVPFNKDTLILASGICYKLDTAESYRICTALIEEGQTKGNLIPRHAYCFAVAFALRRNDIVKAQSLYSKIMSTDSKLCQNLKVIILARSGAVTDAISILSAAILLKSPSFVKKLEFSQEVVDLLRLQSEGGPYMMKVEQVITHLERADQVTQQTIDGMLCHTPTGKRKPALMMEERRTSRRTLKPLQSTLLSE